VADETTDLPPLEPLWKDGSAPLAPAVLWIAAGCGVASGGALVVAILTDRPLWLSATFILVPAFVCFVALTTIARRHQQQLFLIRLEAGAIGGLVATLAYDVSRWAVEVTDLASTNSFVAMPHFGAGLTGLTIHDGAAIATGWVFHFVNGVGFGIAYMMVMAGRRWYWAVLYGLGLEVFMVALYPQWLGVTLSREFLSVSIGGHIAYGAVLGIVAERTE
jgi:hypothetical protein